MEKEQNQQPGGSSVGSGFKMMMVMGGILIVASIVLGIVNWKRAEKQREVAAQSTLTVVQGGQELLTFGPSLVLEVPQEIFEAPALDGDGGQKVPNYTGAPLEAVLRLTDLDLTGVSAIALHSVDGSTVTLTREEWEAEGNAYLVYGRNKKPLGLPTEGGDGPFMLLLRQEGPEGGRWLRSVSVVEFL